MEKFTKWVIGVLILNIIITLGISRHLQIKMDEQRSSMQSQIDYLNQNIEDLEQRLYEQMKRALSEQEDQVSAFEYEFVNIDTQSKRAQLRVKLDLKEANTSSAYTIVFYEEGENRSVDENKMLLKHVSGMSYEGNIKIDIQKNYTIEVVESVKQEVQRQITAITRSINLYDDFYGMRAMYHGSGWSFSNDIRVQEHEFSVRDFGLGGFELEAVLFQVFLKDKLLSEKDITLALRPDEALEDGRMHYRHEIAIRIGKDYQEDLNDRNMEDLNFKYILKFKDGYIVEL